MNRALPAVGVIVMAGALAQGAPIPVDAARVEAIAAMLPEKPQGVGPTIGERAAWERAGALSAYRKLLEEADRIVKEAVPEQTDALYLLYSQNGDRDQWQTVAFDRRRKFQVLVVAECVRNDGRYLPRIKEYLEALCAEKTWVYPAHDGRLENFHGKIVDIDLGSATLGWNMATTAWMLGDKLDAETRQLIAQNLEKRLLEPMRNRIQGKTSYPGWVTNTSNWNAVCFAGVVGTALATVEDRRERARLVAAAEVGTRQFLQGFTDDGYCTEGLGYWNYGFGRYVMLAETVKRATGEGVDFLEGDKVRLVGAFARRIGIAHGLSPAFADCHVNARPEAWVSWYANKRFAQGLPEYAALDMERGFTELAGEAVYRVAPPTFSAAAAGIARPEVLRDYFDKTGVLIARPKPGSAVRMAVALKGGSNHEHHNHNDVGSYVVVVGTAPDNARTPLFDPGPERYTARTFSARRYESKLLSSFGHSVPVVAGQLQREGNDTDARVLKTEFTEEADTFALDIAKAYRVPELKELTRTWVYSRKEAGELTVTDAVEFTSPQKFATTLIAPGRWKTAPDGRLILEDGPQAVIVTVKASGAYSIAPETIEENAPVKPNRLLISLDEPAVKAEITLRIVPR